MPRPTVGKVIEHDGRDGRVYRALRFTAYRKRRYVSLGAVSAEDAERELRHVVADVERGKWKAPVAVEPPPEPRAVPTFHEFAEEWWQLHQHEWAPKTVTDYRWRLERNLLPVFGEIRLDQISFDTVERYIAAKRGETRPLCPSSINKTVILLAAILESAVERELIGRNPAKGKGRRVRERAPVRSYLDGAGQIKALLDAAAMLDQEATKERQHIERRAMLATLIFAGLRIGELCELRWRDIDLAGGWLRVGQAKTDAGRRRVKLRGALRDELLAVRGRHPDAGQEGFVFPTRTGAQQSADNVRARVLGGSLRRADKRLSGQGLPPLPAKITPHSLRRTFASVLYALGEDPGVVMDEMGHTDEGLALRIYRQSMRREDHEKMALRTLVEGSALTDTDRARHFTGAAS